ncbi:P-loop containing nucleoside triphosphate hydrolase protein, partial [Podospora fimiseda]
PPLCEEQLAIINEAKKGRNICYVGSAGSGKSTVLHELRRELQDQGKVVQVLSPTGIVALQINGDTTWRFAGWKPSDVTRPFVEVAQLRDEDTGKQRGVKNLRLKRIRKVDVIIIDEISMVENSFFTRLDWLLREAKDRNKPFGGVQVIITGDFFQLAPVKPVKNCVTCGTKLITDHEDAQYRICTTCKGRFDIEAKFAFCSKSWDECNFLYMSLTKIHRQRDAEFVALLEKCREGSKFAPREIELLECQKPGLDEKKATRLFSTKREVRAVNTKFFNELPGPSVEYRCYDEYERVSSEHPPWYGDRFDKPDTFYDKHDQDDRKKLSGSLRILEDHRWETHLELKKGMRVMLIHNLDIKGSLCNGSQGEVVDFEPFSDSTVPTAQTNNNPEGTIVGAYKHKREAHIRTFANICKAQYEFLGWPIVHFDNGRKKTIYPECTVNEMGAKKPYSLLCRAQVPLTAGYALSIHKSQGMTLDYVMVDLTRTFEIEQIYVALSRARSLDGLLVKGLQESEDRYGGRFSMTGKAVVQKFYNERFG